MVFCGLFVLFDDYVGNVVVILGDILLLDVDMLVDLIVIYCVVLVVVMVLIMMLDDFFGYGCILCI